jgi:hypothetical protein
MWTVCMSTTSSRTTVSLCLGVSVRCSKAARSVVHSLAHACDDVAEMRGVTTKSMYAEYELDLGD